MIAILRYAGGNCEFRFFQEGDFIAVQHWHTGADGDMERDTQFPEAEAKFESLVGALGFAARLIQPDRPDMLPARDDE